MPGENSMFLDFFGKNSMFFVVFQAKSRFLPPPWKIFALPWKKVCGRPWMGEATIAVKGEQ
jgi:hypothetical protein